MPCQLGPTRLHESLPAGFATTAPCRLVPRQNQHHRPLVAMNASTTRPRIRRVDVCTFAGTLLLLTHEGLRRSKCLGLSQLAGEFDHSRTETTANFERQGHQSATAARSKLHVFALFVFAAFAGKTTILPRRLWTCKTFKVQYRSQRDIHCQLCSTNDAYARCDHLGLPAVAAGYGVQVASLHVGLGSSANLAIGPRRFLSLGPAI